MGMEDRKGTKRENMINWHFFSKRTAFNVPTHTKLVSQMSRFGLTFKRFKNIFNGMSPPNPICLPSVLTYSLHWYHIEFWYGEQVIWTASKNINVDNLNSFKRLRRLERAYTLLENSQIHVCQGHLIVRNRLLEKVYSKPRHSRFA